MNESQLYYKRFIETDSIDKYNELIKELVSRCTISCCRCLDIKKLWKSRDSSFAWMDGRGWYDIINCDKCSDGGWLYCSSVNRIVEFGVTIQARDNDFLEAIKERISTIIWYILPIIIQKDKENKDREAKEIEKKLKLKIDEEQKIQDEIELEKKVENEMNDGRTEPLFDEDLSKDFIYTTDTIHINIELGKIINQVSSAVKAHGGDFLELANLIKNLKIDIDYSNDILKVNKNVCQKSKNLRGYPIYFIMKTTLENINESCSLLEYCGCKNTQTKIVMKYIIMRPKNIVARDICDKTISDITSIKLKKIMSFLIE
jgi:hypothetical protein